MIEDHEHGVLTRTHNAMTIIFESVQMDLIGQKKMSKIFADNVLN